jgi:uncharacterized protein
VSALCPGATESGFQAAAAMQESRMVQSGMMKADEVARVGYAGLMANQRVIVPGLINRLIVLMPRLLPRGMVTGIAMNAQSRVLH